MSIRYRASKAILMNDLFSGRLAAHQIIEHFIYEAKDPNALGRCLTDGHDYLYVYGRTHVALLTRFGGNDVSGILRAIENEFDCELYAEDQPPFHGLESQAELDEWYEANRIRCEDERYIDLLMYATGQPSIFNEETFVKYKAEIAREVIKEHPELAHPAHKYIFLREIEAIFDSKYSLEDYYIERQRAIMARESTARLAKDAPGY